MAAGEVSALETGKQLAALNARLRARELVMQAFFAKGAPGAAGGWEAIRTAADEAAIQRRYVELYNALRDRYLRASRRKLADLARREALVEVAETRARDAFGWTASATKEVPPPAALRKLAPPIVSTAVRRLHELREAAAWARRASERLAREASLEPADSEGAYAKELARQTRAMYEALAEAIPLPEAVTHRDDQLYERARDLAQYRTLQAYVAQRRAL